MLYPRCPTCGTILANKQLPYEQMTEELCESKTLSQEELDKKRMEILDKLNIKRICCRSRVITYIDKVKLIK
jgi:DNA-directed RNA polymerase subunit N (RpoN/RPB10)